MSDSREEHGRLLARAGKVSQRSALSWLVHGNKDYVVLLDPETCTCPDWAIQRNRGGEGRRCKHIWAVHFTMDKVSSVIPATTPKTRGRIAWEV